jgi:hypothetical protein
MTERIGHVAGSATDGHWGAHFALQVFSDHTVNNRTREGGLARR